MTNDRNYIYVMPTQGYVKLGISTDPARRLAEHRIDLVDSMLRFSHVWHSDVSKYKRVERIAKIILEDYDRDSPERVFAPRLAVAAAIEKAAAVIDAPLIAFDIGQFNDEADYYYENPPRWHRKKKQHIEAVADFINYQR